MVIERWLQIKSLFDAIHEKPVGERARFLEKVCGADHELRREVASLLACEDSAAGFLESEWTVTAPLPMAGEPVHAGERIGPYTILEPLGAGGMGQVYKAYDSRLDRYVAVKFLARGMTADPATRQQFQREARAASALNHQNICTVHDVGEFQDRPFIVMELLEGYSLKDRIAAGPVDAQDLSRTARQICAALQAAHDRGIVHRDVKPGNIFVTGAGQVKILDFGLAQQATDVAFPSPPADDIQSTLTAASNISGTLGYMSPEQAVGNNVDSRSDIFSLGVVLYEMATGRRAFRGRTPAGILGSLLTESPEKPSFLNNTIPACLDRIILKAIEKEPANRYQSASAVAEDFAKWQDGTAISTRRKAVAALGIGVAGMAGGVFLARWSTVSHDKPVIAVLPFEDQGRHPQQPPLANGLHQEMISVLNRLYPDHLSVISRNSIKRYHAAGTPFEQIGRDLKADYIVKGGVGRDGDHVRVTVRLTRVRDQKTIWDEIFNRNLSQIAAAQAEIAQGIAQGIERGLRPDAQVSAALIRPVNVRAHEAYLRGDYQAALEIDPGYAAAYSGLANDTYYPALFGFEPPRETFSRMMGAASKALELDPTQATAHACMALGNLHLHWDWAAAEEGFRRALQLNPGDPDTRHFYAHLLLWKDRGAESAAQVHRALEIDPINPDFFSCIGWHDLLASKRADSALLNVRRALDLEPNHWWALMTMGWAYAQKGMFKEATNVLRKSMDCSIKTASIAHVFARSGNRSGAQRLLDDLLDLSKTKYVSPYDVAIIYAGLDDQTRCFDWLRRAYEEHAGFLVFAKQDPRLVGLRKEARFQDLMRAMRYTGA